MIVYCAYMVPNLIYFRKRKILFSINTNQFRQNETEIPKGQQIIPEDTSIKITQEAVPIINDQSSTSINSAFCIKCGQKLPPDSRFCTKCGTPVSNPPDNQSITQ